MEQSPELRDLIAGYFRSFTAGDAEWVERHVANGDELRLIGTNPDEWLGGVDAFVLFRQEAASATGELSAQVSDIEAYASGGVGWGAAQVRFAIPSGLVARGRFSGVFILVDGTWKVVSSHTSIPVADEEAFSEG